MIIKNDPETIKSYLEDSSNLQGGYAERIVIPEDYSEIPSILGEANTKNLPVTITGGGTGTSGARIPFGGVVLSMEKLNKILGVETKNREGCITSQAGVMIKDLKEYASKNGLFYTYDPTEQTSFVGGTIATNASGARSFKYGSTRNAVHSLKMAFADGAVYEVKRGETTEKGGYLEFEAGSKRYKIKLPKYKIPETKSSAGYYTKKDMDLIDLFIGQEGTLSCVFEVTLKLNMKPEDIFSAFAFFDTEKNAVRFALKARDISLRSRADAGALNALSIEYFDKNSMRLLRAKYHNIPDGKDACIFFEQEISRKDEDGVISEWIKLLKEHNVNEDETWTAMNDREREDLIAARHSMGESMDEMVKKTGMPKVTTDLAVPRDKFMDMYNTYMEYLHNAKIENYLFGHIGSSHLHMNFLPKSKDEYKSAKDIALIFIRKSVALGGTVSAEHGIGKMRREYLKELYGEDGVREMFEIKKALDPNLILGRGTIFNA